MFLLFPGIPAQQRRDEDAEEREMYALLNMRV